LRKFLSPVLFATFLAACVSSDVGPNAPTAELKAKEQLAVKNQMCAFDPHPEGKQSPCAHLIQNRVLFGRIFAPPTLGGLDEGEKLRGRRITTKFIVDAASKIKQCRRVPLDNTINIIRDVKIAGGTYLLKGTAPLSEENSSCFLTPDQESS
jgi:hypothetical protein